MLVLDAYFVGSAVLLLGKRFTWNLVKVLLAGAWRLFSVPHWSLSLVHLSDVAYKLQIQNVTAEPMTSFSGLVKSYFSHRGSTTKTLRPIFTK